MAPLNTNVSPHEDDLMHIQITCSGKPTQSMVFHGLIHCHTNSKDWMVSIT